MQATLNLLIEINNRVNQSTTYKTDLAQYGVVDQWGYVNRGLGDCEDYCLSKRLSLIQAGVDPGTLNVAICKDRSGSGHAVLFARLTDGDWVMDNQTSDVLPWSRVPYEWLEMSVDGSFDNWTDIRQ